MATIAGKWFDELISENPWQSGWGTRLWWGANKETSDVCKRANFKTSDVCKQASFRTSETKWKPDSCKDPSLTLASRRSTIFPQLSPCKLFLCKTQVVGFVCLGGGGRPPNMKTFVLIIFVHSQWYIIRWSGSFLASSPPSRYSTFPPSCSLEGLNTSLSLS